MYSCSKSVISVTLSYKIYIDKTTFIHEPFKKVKLTSNVCPSKSFASHQFPHGSRTLRLLVRYDEIKIKQKVMRLTRRNHNTLIHKIKMIIF